MSTSSAGHAPIYIAKWRLKGSERGRKHMAVFVPNSQYRNVDPSNVSQKCLGTLIHVQGSPLGGFVHNLKRNWDRQRTRRVESIHLLAWVNTQYIPEPTTSTFLEADTTPNGTLDQIALSVRPPGVSQPLWDANAVFDCQDWVYDYVVRLSQRNIVGATVLNTLGTLLDTKTALMPRPGSSSTTPAQPITASVARVTQAIAGQPAEPQAGRGRYSSSEWDGELRAFRRYDHTARRWEYRDTVGVWRPMA